MPQNESGKGDAADANPFAAYWHALDVEKVFNQQVDLLKTFGPDHFLTLAAATLYGCSETTFYVIAVYFGSVGVRRTRHAIPAGIVADITGPVASVIVCRLVFG